MAEGQRCKHYEIGNNDSGYCAHFDLKVDRPDYKDDCVHHYSASEGTNGCSIKEDMPDIEKFGEYPPPGMSEPE